MPAHALGARVGVPGVVRHKRSLPKRGYCSGETDPLRGTTRPPAALAASVLATFTFSSMETMFTGTDLGEISLNQSTTNIYKLQAFVSEIFQRLNSKAPRRRHLMPLIIRAFFPRRTELKTKVTSFQCDLVFVKSLSCCFKPQTRRRTERRSSCLARTPKYELRERHSRCYQCEIYNI